MKKFIIVFVLLGLIAGLAGCNSLVNNLPTLTIIPPSHSPSPILTMTVTPTLSPRPTVTATPTANSVEATKLSIAETDSSYLATNWAPVYAILDRRAVKCEDGYVLEIPENIDQASNDTWSIFTCSPRPEDNKTIWTPGVVDYGKRYTKLLKTDFSKSWTISHQDFSWSQRPNAYLSVERWTQDGNDVYLVPGGLSGCGYTPESYFLTDCELYRFNLNSGELETVLLHTSKLGCANSLSPNDRYLAYAIQDKPKEIYIRDMRQHTETKVELSGDYIMSGAFVWASDSTKVMFAGALNGWEENRAGISVFALTVEKMHLQTMIYNDLRMLVPSFLWYGDQPYWFDQNTVYLTSLKKDSDYFMDNFTLNLQTGTTLFIHTPTPQPEETATPEPGGKK